MMKMTIKQFFYYLRHPLQTLWCLIMITIVMMGVRMAYDIDKKTN